MNLPNYFLADLPADTALTPTMLGEACQTLKRNRAHFLALRSTTDIIRTLDHVAKQWLQLEYPIRKLAVDRGSSELQFSRSRLTRGLDDFFKQLNGENLEELVTAELGHPHRLDDLVATPQDQHVQRAAMARGPELLLHITAGPIPNPSLSSIVLGLLVRSAQFVKCASGTALLPRLFAHSIYEAEPKLGACLEIAVWRGGNAELERTIFSACDCVTATGSDETLSLVRQRLPSHVRFLGYGHRVSFGYITREALSGFSVQRHIKNAATDVTAWNQLGCLSPHLLYVENSGRTSPEQFAEMLALELREREEAEPRGPIPADAAAAIASRRSFYEVRAANSPETRLWQSEGSTAWTVVYEADPAFQLSCLNCFIYVKGVSTLTEALHALEMVRGKVSTVGIAAADFEAPRLALELTRWGAPRICPLGQMQSPPLSWRHDGRPALGDLVTWTDWEK
ncbi:MAG: hypothetical protein L0Z50_14425 [Verrucomicrobiales bacterium]|nr:hypothetical protein [Verrucomicrobiales bacterium]